MSRSSSSAALALLHRRDARRAPDGLPRPGRLEVVGVTHTEVTIVEAFAAWTLARILGAIPITPGGVGFVEPGLTAALVAFGASNAEAVAGTMIYRFLTVVPTVLVGLVAAGASVVGRKPVRRPSRSRAQSTKALCRGRSRPGADVSIGRETGRSVHRGSDRAHGGSALAVADETVCLAREERSITCGWKKLRRLHRRGVRRAHRRCRRPGNEEAHAPGGGASRRRLDRPARPDRRGGDRQRCEWGSRAG